MILNAERFAEQIIVGYGREGRGFLAKAPLAALIQGRDVEKVAEFKASLLALPSYEGNSMVKLEDVLGIIEEKPKAGTPALGRAFEGIPDPIKPKAKRKG
jgi:hypothetical protein